MGATSPNITSFRCGDPPADPVSAVASNFPWRPPANPRAPHLTASVPQYSQRLESPAKQKPTHDSIIIHMLPRLAAALFFAALLPAQNNWFRPAILQEPTVAKALQAVDDRSSAIMDEWVRLVEIPAPSAKEQARASTSVAR